SRSFRKDSGASILTCPARSRGSRVNSAPSEYQRVFPPSLTPDHGGSPARSRHSAYGGGGLVGGAGTDTPNPGGSTSKTPPSRGYRTAGRFSGVAARAPSPASSSGWQSCSEPSFAPPGPKAIR